ncbi:hypothetical protein EVA_21612 [gut metagenome]|uniref:Uncharacterized protein n=1 Tax=gut metagenome TaxID=749906 RepID=J9BRS6_9ZZZZ
MSTRFLIKPRPLVNAPLFLWRLPRLLKCLYNNLSPCFLSSQIYW